MNWEFGNWEFEHHNIRMAGIILAGGVSSRMGEDKALLPWRGGTLLDNAVVILSEVVDPVFVVVDSTRKRPAGRAAVILDDFPAVGPLGGIVTGLRCARTGFHLVVACDLPMLQDEMLVELLVAANEAPYPVDAVIPEVAGRDQVLCAVYSHTALAALDKALASGERAVHRAIRDLRCLRIPESRIRQVDPELLSFKNINTREEYEHLWRQYGQT